MNPGALVPSLWRRATALALVLTVGSLSFWFGGDFRGLEVEMTASRRFVCAVDTCFGTLGWLIQIGGPAVAKLKIAQGLYAFGLVTVGAICYGAVVQFVLIILGLSHGRSTIVRHCVYGFEVAWFFSGLLRAGLRVS